MSSNLRSSKTTEIIADHMFLPKSPSQKMHWFFIRLEFVIHYVGSILASSSQFVWNLGDRLKIFLNTKSFPNSTLWATSVDIKTDCSQYCRLHFPTGGLWESMWLIVADVGSLLVFSGDPFSCFWHPFGTLVLPFYNFLASSLNSPGFLGNSLWMLPVHGWFVVACQICCWISKKSTCDLLQTVCLESLNAENVVIQVRV